MNYAELLIHSVLNTFVLDTKDVEYYILYYCYSDNTTDMRHCGPEFFLEIV